MREDVYFDKSSPTQEYVERHTALWAVLDEIVPGDLLVVEAPGNRRSGVVGEMLASHLQNRGGVGIATDGSIRDSGRIVELGLPIWSHGATPHYASQGELMPWAYHTPVSVGNALVIPGDYVIADDDGAVVVPRQLAQTVVELSLVHEEWESFSRMKLAEGGELRTYYPLNAEGQLEYEAWRSTDGA